MLDALRRSEAALTDLAVRTFHRRSGSLWGDLIGQARANLKVKPLDDVHYGDAHWRATAAIGLALCDGTAVDRRVILAFAILHDSQRHDRLHDADHGHRAALVASGSAVLGKLLGPLGVAQVVEACVAHSDGLVSDDPVIGTCWDADRLAMLQRRRQPHMAYMSTTRCRTAFDDVCDMARRVCEAPPRWSSLISRVAQAPGPRHTGPSSGRNPMSRTPSDFREKTVDLPKH